MVRSYREKILDGDEGLRFGLEYSVPLNKYINAFCFFDGGKIFNSDVDLQDSVLFDTGAGIQLIRLKIFRPQ